MDMDMTIDMFADDDDTLNQQVHDFEDSVLDMTLSELRLDDGFVGDGNEEDEHDMNKDFSELSGPTARSFLLKKSLDSLLARTHDSYSNAIVYETAALSIWSLYKYQPTALRNRMVSKDKLFRFENSVNIPTTANPLYAAYRRHLTADNRTAAGAQPQSSIIEPPGLCKLKDKVDVTNELITRCKYLPDEWNVIQLCKRYQPDHGHQLKYEYNTAPVPLNVTLFKYDRSELMDHAPLCFSIHTDKFNVYKEALDITGEIDECTRNLQIKSELEDIINKHILLLKRFVGPWMVLFSGRAKTKATIAYEQKIFKLVDHLCMRSKIYPTYTPRQQLLLSLVARRTDLLDEEQLDAAAFAISKHREQHIELLEFLRYTVKSVKYADCEYFPTTMIVDELVDYVFWEMVIPTQEFARIGSMAVLFKLFDKYKGQFRDGYVRVKVDKGFVLSNPENNLSNSEKRIEYIFRNWYPEYRTIFGHIPASKEMKEYITTANVYIYAGHGSGLQFIGGRDLNECVLHCVAFLYGCQSVALKSPGLQCESIGPHVFMHYALCPGVVGTLTVTTDTWTDVLTLAVCKMWLPSKAIDYTMDSNWTGLCEYYKKAVSSFMSVPAKKSLLEVLQIIRCSTRMPLRMRCPLVYRGIPVAR